MSKELISKDADLTGKELAIGAVEDDLLYGRL